MISATCQQTVRCPNCGSEAQRRYFKSKEATYSSCSGNQVIQTECNQCDYLMVMCSLNGNVVEAYAPGIWTFSDLSQRHHLPAIAVKNNWPLPLVN
jgi:hypothetical protein